MKVVEEINVSGRLKAGCV